MQSDINNILVHTTNKSQFLFQLIYFLFSPREKQTKT